VFDKGDRFCVIDLENYLAFFIIIIKNLHVFYCV